jgi:N-acetylglutamate synthase-like GNAT family acetyltransferase
MFRVSFVPEPTSKKGKGKTAQKKAKSVIQTLHVSKLLLTAQSEYFRALFESGFKEADQKSVRNRLRNSVYNFCQSYSLPYR